MQSLNCGYGRTVSKQDFNRRKARNRCLALSAALTPLLMVARSQAAADIYTPTNSITDTWSLGTNWGSIPASSLTTELTYVGTNSTVLGSITNVNTDNIAGAFNLNILDLQGTGNTSGAVSTVTINASTGSSLNFNGTTPVINLNALKGTAGLLYNVNAPISMSAALTMNASGTATSNFSGGISGSFGLTIQNIAATATATGPIGLTGTNTYTGVTTIKGGALSGDSVTLNVTGNDSAANGGWSFQAGNNNGTSTTNFLAGAIEAVSSSGAFQIGPNVASGNTQTVNFAGTMNNAGALNINRGGVLTMTSGAGWNQSGGMQVAAPSGSGFSSTMNVGTGATFNYNGSSTISLSPAASAGGVALLTVGGTFNTSAGFTDATATTTGAGALLNLSGGTLLVAGTSTIATLVPSPIVVNLTGTASVINTSGSLGTNTITSVINGSTGVLNKSGLGTLTLSNANNYGGGTVINNNGGNLAITNAAALGTGVVTIAKSGYSSGTLQLNLTGTNTIGNTFNGSNSTTFNGSNTVPNIENVSGNNTITSNLVVTGAGGNGEAFQSDAGLLTLSGSIGSTISARGLELNGAGNGLISGSINNNNSGGTSFTFFATKDGTGTWTFSGQNNYSGGTTINAGVLNLGSAQNATTGPLGNSSGGVPIGKVTFGGGTLQYSSVNAADYSPAFATTAQPIQIDTNGRTVTFASPLMSGTAGSLTLNDTNGTPGSLTLAAASTYTGFTNVSAGSLVLNAISPNTGALSSSAVSISAGASFLVKGTTSVASLSLAGTPSPSILNLQDGTINTLSMTGNLSVGTGTAGSAISLDLGSANGSNDAITVAGSLTAAGTTTINIDALSSLAAGVTSYTLLTDTGGTSVAGGAGFTIGAKPAGFNSYTLANSTANALILTVTAGATPSIAYWTGLASTAVGDSANSWGDASTSPQHSNWSTTADGSTDPLQVPGGTTDVVFTAQNAASVGGELSTQLETSYGIKGISFDTSNASSAISSVVINSNGNALTLGSDGLVIGVNDNSSTTLNGSAAGILIGTNQSWANNSSSQSLTVNTGINGTVAGSTQTLTFNGTGTGGIILNGVIGDGTGTGGHLALAFNQAGIVQLNGSNTFTGGVSISSGTVLVGNAGALNLTAPNAVAFSAGSTGDLKLNGYSVTITGLSTDPTTPGSAIVENANATNATLTTAIPTGVTTAFAGVLRDGTAGGTLSLTKTGLGTLVLAGANTFTGATQISGGAINYQLGAAMVTTSPITVTTGGSAQLQGGITAGTAFTTTIAGSGGTGTTGALESVSGSNNFPGAISLSAAATISSDAGSTFNISNSGNISDNGNNLTLGGVGNGIVVSGINSNLLTKNGTGTWSLLGNNGYSFTNISNGTLQILGYNSLPGQTVVGFTNTTATATLDITGLNVSISGLTLGTQTTGTVNILGNSSTGLSVSTGNNNNLTLVGAGSASVFTMNMSSVGSFSYGTGFGSFIVNGGTAATVGSGVTTVDLAGGTNTINAATFGVGDQGTSTGVSTAIVNLGANATINVSNIYVGNSGSRANGVLNAGSGTLTILGLGGSGTANLTIGRSDSFAVTDITNSVMDTTAGTLNAALGNVIIGEAHPTNSITGNRGVNVSGTLKMGAGTLNAGAITIGVIDAATSDAGSFGYQEIVNGNFSITGGTASVSTITLGSSSYAGNFNTSIASTITAAVTLNTGSTLIANTIAEGTITPPNAGTLTVSPQINWNDGTFANLNGNALSISNATINLAGAAANHAFNISSGATASISSVINGSTGALTIAGPGTVNLSATNTYLGQTNINAGTLQLASTGSINKSSGVVIQGGATFDVSAQAAYVSAQPLSAPGTGAATVLGEFNASTSAINLQDGTNLGTMAFNNGLTLSNTPLSFDLGPTLTSDLISVSGTVLTGGTETISVGALTSLTSLTAGDYTLITATGGGLGTNFNLASNTLAVGSNSYSLSLANSSSGSEVLSVAAVVATSGQWISPISGSWEVNSNWQGNIIAKGVSQTATFADSIGTSSATVTLTANETVGIVAFTGTQAGSYTIAANASTGLTLNNGASAAVITVNSGIQTITAPVTLTNGVNVNTATGSSLAIGGPFTGVGPFTDTTGSTISVSANGSIGVPVVVSGSLTFSQGSSGILVRTVPSLNIASGTVAVAGASSHANRQLLSTGALTVSGTATLDLTNNDMLVNNGSLGTITALVKQGYSGRTWLGTGITSSSAASDSTHLTALGVIQNSVSGSPSGTVLQSSFDTTASVNTDVLVKYTLYGDANLDGKVDGTDYSRIDNGVINNLSGWYNGDFNYDGVINGSDYTLIDNAYNTQGASLAAEVATPTAQVAGAGSSAVPEPATLGLLGIGAAGLLGRRRRRSR